MKHSRDQLIVDRNPLSEVEHNVLLSVEKDDIFKKEKKFTLILFSYMAVC